MGRSCAYTGANFSRLHCFALWLADRLAPSVEPAPVTIGHPSTTGFGAPSAEGCHQAGRPLPAAEARAQRHRVPANLTLQPARRTRPKRSGAVVSRVPGLGLIWTRAGSQPGHTFPETGGHGRSPKDTKAAGFEFRSAVAEPGGHARTRHQDGSGP
jgi:hypothetical protein